MIHHLVCAFGLTNQIIHKTHDMLEVKDGSHQPSLFVHHGHSATLEQYVAEISVVTVILQTESCVNLPGVHTEGWFSE